MLNCRHFNFLILVNNYVNLNLLVFRFIYRSENSKFLIQNSQIALTRIHAPRKSMQRYYFFSTWPNNPRKKRNFSAFFHQKLSLSLFCHLDFTKFTLFFTSFAPFKLSYKHSSFNHLQTFSTPYFFLLRTSLFTFQIPSIFASKSCLFSPPNLAYSRLQIASILTFKSHNLSI